MPVKQLLLYSVILLLIVCNSGIGQTKLIDSLKLEVKRATTKEKKIKNLLLLCEERQSMPSDTLYRYASEANKIATEINDDDLSLQSRYYLYICHLKNGKPDSVLANCNEALNALKVNNGNFLLELQLLHLKSLAFMRNNEFEKAIAQNFELLHRSELFNDTLMQIKAKNGIGWAYMEMNQFRDAISWYKKALETTPNETYFQKYLAVYNNIASAYNNVDHTDSAFYFINKSLQALQTYEDLTAQSNALNIKADIFINTHNAAAAESLLQEALMIRMRIGDPFYIVSDFYQLSVFYAHNGQAKKGISTALRGIETARQYNLTAKLPLLYSGLAESYKMAGNMQQYAAVLETIIQLKDTLFEKNSAEALAELESRYNVQKNENIIMQQKIEILKRDYFIAGSVVLFFMLLAGVYFFYRSYKERQGIKLEKMMHEQKERELYAISEAEENQRKRIAAELHDNLGAQISFITSNIDWILDSPKPLSEAEQQVHLRNVQGTSQELMRTLRDTLWALNRDKINLDEFADKLKSYIQVFLQFRPQLHFESHEQLNSVVNLNPLQALNMFRIFQEAVNNAIKYSKANNLGLRVTTKNKNFEIALTDNGKGFDRKKINGEHYGLKNMEYRASEAGLQFLITSETGKGTEIRVCGNVTNV